MASSVDMAKDARIKKELAKLKKQFSNIDEKKRAVVEKLMQNAAFMAATLEDLQSEINIVGSTGLFKNGSQEMITETAAQKSYNTMINRYNAAIKTLLDLLPKETAVIADDGFADFVGVR